MYEIDLCDSEESSRKEAIVLLIIKCLSKRQAGWIMLLCCILTWMLLIPQLVVQSLTNWGELLLLHTVTQRADNLDYYSLWNLDNNNQAEKVQQIFAAIPRFMPPDSNWEWRNGRTALINGQAAVAVRVLTVQKALSEPFNSIRFLDTLEAHSRAGHDADVIELYASCQAHPCLTHGRLISDTVALAYLNQAQTQIDAGHPELARSLLQQVLKLRPFDLYTNYWLWRSSLQSSREAQTYFNRFSYFTLVAVKPQPDERFLEHFFSVFLDVLAQDQWGEARSINLVSYWVWQYPAWPALGKLLDLLTGRFPERAIWPRLQGERYHRLRKFDLAASYYRLALVRQPEDNLAQAQLARLSDDNIEFHAGSVSDQELVAQILGVPSKAVEIGANLSYTTTIPMVNFNVVGGSTDWPFIESSDPFEAASSLRIFNLWWPATDQVSGFKPYAEYHSQNVLIDTEWVMISVLFRVDGDTNHFGFLTIGNALSTDWQPYFTNANLLDTSGHWVKAVVVGRVPLPNNQWFSLLRNWGAASTWYSQLTVHPIKFTDTPNHCTHEPCVYFQSLALK